MSTRESFLQVAQENIKRAMYEHPCEEEFFRDLKIITSDQADILTEIETTIATLGLCIVVEVLGGPAPILEDITDWDAIIIITESPTLNRGANFNGKTADVVLDAVLRTFNGELLTYFTPKRVRKGTEQDGTVIFIIEGSTNILLKSTNRPCGALENEESND